MSSLPDPLTPATLDLREFDWMPLDVKRLRDSDLSVLAPGDAFRAAVLLWCAAWHQVPAASLPKEDRLLANLAGYGRDLKGWASVRDDAMRGFIECSDGRLYHPVVAEKALEANEQRNAKRRRTEAASSARRNGKRYDDRNDIRNDAADDKRNEVHPTSDLTLPSEAIASDKGASDFERFWEEYPKRDGDNPRQPAKMKFEALVKSGVDPALMIAGARQYADEMRRKGKIGTEYVAHALKWLTQQRWADIAAASFVVSEGLKVVTSKVFVVEGTPEWYAQQSDRREKGLRPTPAVDERDENRRPTGRVGFWFEKQFPDGYDEATGEKLPASSDEAAA